MNSWSGFIANWCKERFELDEIIIGDAIDFNNEEFSFIVEIVGCFVVELE